MDTSILHHFEFDGEFEVEMPRYDIVFTVHLEEQKRGLMRILIREKDELKPRRFKVSKTVERNGLVKYLHSIPVQGELYHLFEKL